MITIEYVTISCLTLKYSTTLYTTCTTSNLILSYLHTVSTIGGRITHDCGTSRSIGYFIEGILPLLIFAKEKSYLTFQGITNDSQDLSVDVLKSTTIPLLAYIGVAGVDLQVKKRGTS
jgi:RNA 3'-terminal phosphate cyclase